MMGVKYHVRKKETRPSSALRLARHARITLWVWRQQRSERSRDRSHLRFRRAWRLCSLTLEHFMDFSSGLTSETRVRVTYGLKASPEPESPAGIHQPNETDNWATFWRLVFVIESLEPYKGRIEEGVKRFLLSFTCEDQSLTSDQQKRLYHIISFSVRGSELWHTQQNYDPHENKKVKHYDKSRNYALWE